jgi:hypothetical protein
MRASSARSLLLPVSNTPADPLAREQLGLTLHPIAADRLCEERQEAGSGRLKARR